MLAYLEEDSGIYYVIVDKHDRLTLNPADDREINWSFKDTGVRLMSTSEDIDQTPAACCSTAS